MIITRQWNALYCRTAACIFLRKVGRGYIFIHRMLMVYFTTFQTQATEKVCIHNAAQQDN